MDTQLLDRSKNGDFLKIAVVGGGIIGLTSAVALQEAFPLAQMDVLAYAWTPNLTSNIAAGEIFPSMAGEQTPTKLLRRLLGESIQFYRNLMQTNPASGQIGISRVTAFELSREENVEIPYLPELPEIRRMSKQELNELSPASEYRSGFVFITYVAECTKLMPYLMDKIRENAGQFKTQKITSLNSLLPDYDLVINCTGLGSRYLLDVQDFSLEPVRGQIVRVKAPWIRHTIIADGFYIIPNQDSILLGGTKDKGNYSLEPDPLISERILAGCTKLLPSLKHADKIGDFVGLRPYRPSIRIQVEPTCRKIIHNYGHGGAGVTLCWGSAMEVVRLARNILLSNKIKTKLSMSVSDQQK